MEDGTVRLIRAATAMTFMATLCIGFSFQISLRSYLKEQKQKHKEMEQSLPFSVPTAMKPPVDAEETVRF